MRVLRGIGLEPRIRATAFQPRSWTNRDWDTGALTQRVAARRRRRGEIRRALSADAPRRPARGAGLARAGRTHRARQEARRSRLARRPASRCALPTAPAPQADAVIAADGIHSRVRELWLGAEKANFTGRVAYRTTFPAALLDGYRDRRMLQVVGAGPPHRDLLRHREPRRGLFRHQRAGAGVHRRILVGDRRPRKAARAPSPAFTSRSGASSHACPRVHKWAIVDRDPAAALGRRPDGAARRRRPSDDAIHGAGRGHRDGGRGRAQPLHRGVAGRHRRRRSRRYEAVRRERTARIQGTSQQNTFMRQADRSGLGLRLRRLDRAAGRSLPPVKPMSASRLHRRKSWSGKLDASCALITTARHSPPDGRRCSLR